MQARWAENKWMRNTELCFVCKVGQFENAEFVFIAKDIYNLYINGEFIQYGPARAAKGYAREERVDLAPYLTKKENVICVYVQSNNTSTLCFALEKPLFAAEIRVEGKTALTTDDFRCFEMTDKLQKVERMSSQRGYLEVYRMEKDRQPFDEALYPECKLIPTDMPKLLSRNVALTKRQETKGVFVERGNVTIDKTKVWENDFTRLLDSGKQMLTYSRAECDCVLSKEMLSFVFGEGGERSDYRYETYSFGRTHCGKFKITISVKEKATLWLAYDDILIDGKVKFNREQITHALKWELEKGEYTLYSNEVYTAKYTTFVFLGEAELQEIAIIRVENPNAKRLTFSCADKTLESIFAAARHTFEHNGYDLLTDCPSRERAGYLCDGFFAARAESFFCGENLAEKNLLENYALYTPEHFTHKGILPMCYPSEPKDKQDFIPNWLLWYLLELSDYVERTGDLEFVRGQKEQIYNVLEYFQSKENEYGLLENLDGWVFVEWSRANDFVDGVNFPSNMCYYGAMKAVAKLFEDNALAKKAERLKSTVVEWSYNGTFFVDNALRVDGRLQVTDNISETCQNYAAFFEMFTREENSAFYERLMGELGCFYREQYHGGVYASNMFIGYILRLLVLLREGVYEQLLAECKNRFGDMAESTGTIWELFQTDASCNHGFGSVVGQMIAYALCGVVRADESAKTVYLSEKTAGVDCVLGMPLRGGRAEIKVENGKRSICLPTAYEMVILKNQSI